jgi:hypothetical protein
VTARQPFLGKLEWIDTDIQKIKEQVEKRSAEKTEKGENR